MFQQPLRPSGHVHVEFRAGRMDWDGRLVTADKRKGKIVLYTSEEEQLTHFQWIDREKNEVALDLIVINDAYLEKIDKCTTGRVYLLRFTSSDKKLFFWLQEPKDDNDEDLVKKFNEAIGAKVPDKSAAKAAGATVPSTATATAGSVAPAQAAAVDPQLRAILQQFLEGQGSQGPRDPPTPLGAVLTSEVLTGLLTDDAAVAEMLTLLPDSHKSPEGLREVLTSPQLQQSLSSLTQAVHSDQLPVLMASLGLDPSAIASAPPGADALEVLCRAMQAQLGGDGGSSEPGGTEGAGGAGGASS